MASLRYQLSRQYKITLLYSHTATAPKFLKRLTSFIHLLSLRFISFDGLDTVNNHRHEHTQLFAKANTNGRTEKTNVRESLSTETSINRYELRIFVIYLKSFHTKSSWYHDFHTHESVEKTNANTCFLVVYGTTH